MSHYFRPSFFKERIVNNTSYIPGKNKKHFLTKTAVFVYISPRTAINKFYSSISYYSIMSKLIFVVG